MQNIRLISVKFSEISIRNISKLTYISSVRQKEYKSYRFSKYASLKFPTTRHLFKNIHKMSMSSEAVKKLVAEHDNKGRKFFITLGEDIAKLEYEQNGDILIMWHTEVPPALQGMGIAKILAQAAFDYAVKNELKMSLTCTYLQKYYKDNPKEEYKRLVIN